MDGRHLYGRKHTENTEKSYEKIPNNRRSIRKEDKISVWKR